MEFLELAIYEAEINGDITGDQSYELFKVYTEGTLSNPIRKFKNLIKEIKDTKPSEYANDEEVKAYVDKHYHDIMKSAEILEKEPSELRKNEVKNAFIGIVDFLIWIGTYLGGIAIVAAGSPATGMAVAILGSILSLIHPTVTAIVQYIRKSDDIKAMDDLTKVKKALNRIDKKTLPESYQRRISDAIDAIDDAETEIRAIVKTTKESVDTTAIRMKIYEKELAGEITVEEREDLLMYLEAKLV